MRKNRENRLKILEIFIEEIISKNNKIRREKRCKCICRCGKEIITNYDRVKNNITSSCGCFLKEERKRLGLKLASKTDIITRQVNYLFAQHKSHCKYNNRETTITKEKLKEFVFSNCYYCGNPPFNLVKKEVYGGPFYYNGIDRIDSSKGYIENNIIPCCIICNRAKMNMDFIDFKIWINRLINHNR